MDRILLKKERPENLILLNSVRIVAQNIKNPGFKREYQAIINPILSKYQQNICSDDEMLFRIKEAIKKINHLADTYMYVPNMGGLDRTFVARLSEDFSDHENLMGVYMITDNIMKKKRIN